MVVLLISLSAISAANVTDDTSTVSSLVKHAVVKDTTAQKVVKDTTVQKAVADNKVGEITKTDTKNNNIKSNTIKTENKAINEIQSEEEDSSSEVDVTSDLNIDDNSYDNKTLNVASNVKVTSNVSKINNIAFNLNGNNITLNGLNISNDNNQPISITSLTGSSNITIANSNINITNTNYGETKAIVIENSSNVVISNVSIVISTLAQDLGWKQVNGNWVSDLQTSGIIIDNSTDVEVSYNNISVTNATEPSEYYNYSTMEAITVRTTSSNVSVINNTIDIEGAYYLYAIDVTDNVVDALVENNTIQLTGMNHICGIQLSSSSNSTVRRNTITGTCNATSGSTASYEAFAYGVALASSWGATASEATGNVIDSNTISLNSTIAYGIELSNSDETNVTNNNVTVCGNVVMALGIYNSSDCYIAGNTFNVCGNTRTLHSWIYEAIYPVTTGIKINETSYGNNITNNYIDVSDSGNVGTIYSVIIEDNCEGNLVKYNNLTATESGDDSVYVDPLSDNEVSDNN